MQAFFISRNGFQAPLAMSNFGDWLKDARHASGLTYRALGERAGLSHVQIMRIEGGDSDLRRSSAERIINALAQEVDADEINSFRRKGWTAFAGIEDTPEMTCEAWDEDTLEVAHFFHGVADPTMRARVKRIMKSAVEIFDEEPEDAGPSGNRTD